MAKILLVEDDINLRDVYAARLESEGYEISVASNGEEALAVAMQQRPDLILLDIMMPKISGYDVLDIIRTTPEIAHTKVIMMTALSADNERERGEKLGVDRYLVKSQVILEDVVSTIGEVLNSPAKPFQSNNPPIVGHPEVSNSEPMQTTNGVNTQSEQTQSTQSNTNTPTQPTDTPNASAQQ